MAIDTSDETPFRLDNTVQNYLCKTQNMLLGRRYLNEDRLREEGPRWPRAGVSPSCLFIKHVLKKLAENMQ